VRIVLLCGGLRCRVVVDFSVWSDRPTKVFVSILFLENLWMIMYGFVFQMVFERSAAVSLWFLSSFVALAFQNIWRSAACLRAFAFFFPCLRLIQAKFYDPYNFSPLLFSAKFEQE
jgi:hypothetical protein